MFLQLGYHLLCRCMLSPPRDGGVRLLDAACKGGEAYVGAVSLVKGVYDTVQETHVE